MGVNHGFPAKISSKKETPCSALPLFWLPKKPIWSLCHRPKERLFGLAISTCRGCHRFTPGLGLGIAIHPRNRTPKPPSPVATHSAREPDFRRVLVWTSFLLKGCQVPGQLVEGQNPVLLIWLCILMWNAFPNDWTYIYIYIYIPTCRKISPVTGCGLFRGPAKWCFSLLVSL